MKLPPPINRAQFNQDPYAQNNERYWLVFVICCSLLLLIVGLFLIFYFSSKGGGGEGLDSGNNPMAEVGDAGEDDLNNPAEDGNQGEQSKSKVKESGVAKSQSPESANSEDGDTDTDGNSEKKTENKVGDLAEQSDSSAPAKSKIPSDDNDDKKQDELPELASLENGNPTVGVFSSSKAGLFGINVAAEKVAYVFDVSSSMNGYLNNSRQNKLIRAKAELINSVKQLDKSQTMSVVLYNTNAIYEPDLIQCKATDKNKKKLEGWLNTKVGVGGTDPMDAMRMILKDDYDVIFLVSDGEFAGSAPRAIKQANSRKIVINTISLNALSQTLKQISKDSGGQFIVVN